MDRVNPLYLPRNHQVEAALTAATAGDLGPFGRLLDAVTRPFDERPGLDEYARPGAGRRRRVPHVLRDVTADDGLPRLGHVILYVADLATSVTFYREVAGLPHRFTEAGYAEFGTGATRLALYERRRAEWLTGHPVRPGPAGELVLVVDDVDAVGCRTAGPRRRPAQRAGRPAVGAPHGARRRPRRVRGRVRPGDPAGPFAPSRLSARGQRRRSPPTQTPRTSDGSPSANTLASASSASAA